MKKAYWWIIGIVVILIIGAILISNYLKTSEEKDCEQISDCLIKYQVYYNGECSADCFNKNVKPDLDRCGNVEFEPFNPETKCRCVLPEKKCEVLEEETECTIEQDCIDSGKCDVGLECTCYKGKCYTGLVAEIPEKIYCETDNDCVKVDAGCCSCNYGGEATAINKDYKEDWNSNLTKECKEIACTAAVSDHISCFSDPKCVNKTCILTPNKERFCNLSSAFINCKNWKGNISENKWNEIDTNFGISCREVFELCEFNIEPGPIGDCLIACPDGSSVLCGQKCPTNYTEYTFNWSDVKM